MPKLNLTAEALHAIHQRAENPLSSNAIKQPNGTWDVPFEADTIIRLQEEMLDGETISDTVLRVCATAGRKAN